MLLKTTGFLLWSSVIKALEVRVETSPTREFYRSFTHLIGVPVTSSQKGVTWCAQTREVVVSDSRDPLLRLLLLLLLHQQQQLLVVQRIAQRISACLSFDLSRERLRSAAGGCLL